VRPIVAVVKTNIAAMRKAKTNRSALPYCGNWRATTGSMAPSANSTLTASTELAASAANHIAT
jgi:hypothetical protein